MKMRELGPSHYVTAGHIILTLTQPVESGWPQRESNPGLPHQESSALPTELPTEHTQVQGRPNEKKMLGWVYFNQFIF